MNSKCLIKISAIITSLFLWNNNCYCMNNTQYGKNTNAINLIKSNKGNKSINTNKLLQQQDDLENYNYNIQLQDYDDPYVIHMKVNNINNTCSSILNIINQLKEDIKILNSKIGEINNATKSNNKIIIEKKNYLEKDNTTVQNNNIKSITSNAQYINKQKNVQQNITQNQAQPINQNTRKIIKEPSVSYSSYNTSNTQPNTIQKQFQTITSSQVNNNRSSYIAPNSNILTNPPTYKRLYTNNINNNMQNQNNIMPAQTQQPYYFQNSTISGNVSPVQNIKYIPPAQYAIQH